MLIKTGVYTGDGTASRNISTGLGVQLRLVIVKGGANNAVFRLSGMSNTYSFAPTAAQTAITALNSDTFTINNSVNVNTNGTVYYWIAFSDADGLGDFTYGSYTGDGTASHSISTTLVPILAIVRADAGQVANFRSTAHTTTSCSPFNAASTASNRIISLDANGFTVGSSAPVNTSGTTYFWFSFSASPKVAVGVYTGDGNDNRDIVSGLGAIVAAFVKSGSASAAAILRNDAFADDSSALVTASASQTNAIQRFNAVGLLDIGTDASVNTSATNYLWFAFGKVLTALFGDDDLELIKHRGATSQIVQVYIRNSSTIVGLSGLTNITSGLTAYYSYNNDTVSRPITLVSMTLGTFTSGGFKEVDAINMPGVYQFGIPDAALANGSGVDIVLQGAANMLECRIKVQLTVSDLDDGTALGLSRIDAAVSSRSTYAGGDTAGVTALLSRIASALTITSGKVDVNDKTGFALTSGEHTNVATDVQTGLTAQGLTTTRAGYLDTLNGLIAAIWAAGTRTLTTFSDSAGITTLLTRIASALTITGGKVDVNDKTAFSLISAYDPAKTAAQLSGIQSALDLLQTHGDSTWSTANVAALLTTSAFNTAITGLETFGNTHWSTADVSALLTAAAFSTAITDLITHGDDNWESSGSGGDQWATVLDGTYTGSQAGAIVLAILTKALLISDGTQITVISPNLPGTNDIILVHNNDYTVGSGRTLPQWTSADWASYDLPNAQSVTLYTQSADTPISLVIPVDVIDLENISVEMGAETFESLEVTTAIAQRAVAPSKHVYSIEAVLADGSHETLVQGNIFIVGSKA